MNVLIVLKGQRIDGIGTAGEKNKEMALECAKKNRYLKVVTYSALLCEQDKAEMCRDNVKYPMMLQRKMDHYNTVL